MSLISALVGIVSVAVSVAESLTVITTAISIVAHTVISVCKALGLIENPEIKTEDLGEKALVAEEEGLKPEKFKTYEEYVQIIEKFEIDPLKAEKYTSEQKMQKGLELTSGLLIDKYGLSAGDVLREVAKRPIFFDTARTLHYLEKTSSNDLNIGDVSKFLDGKLKNVEALLHAKEQVISIEKIINPEATPRQLQQIIDAQKPQ
ncbi:hypothetical protein [Ectobacillus funiculus]|uniref:hypothetical protein n=1 Tax=Ectobacillus funiculus TaxID=137993 RepID=UPI00101D3E94|nr:hypothetical protein [Ectobacillus funiculus]